MIAFLALPLTPALAAPDFMPVSEIETGMRGIAKTVVSGNKIEEFGVEVLGVMKNKGPAGDLILVRTYGDVIERTGGIAQGMSGSPVYINGRLVGAIAYGWGLTDHRTGMVTPIADMLKLWELPDRLREPEVTKKEARKEPPKEVLKSEEETESQTIATSENEQLNNQPIEDAEEDKENKGNEDNRETNEDNNENIIDFDGITIEVPKSLPLMASGFSEQAMAMLRKELSPYNLTVETSGGDTAGNTEIAYKTPQPGSMVGLELIRGDVSLASMGTVTYVEDGKILAFGHPFMKRGNSNYFLTDASVYATLPGIQNSFKIGTSGPAIGLINQDRSAGIAGNLGVFPRIVPIRVAVHDKTMGVSKNLSAQAAHDEALSPILAAVTVYNAIEKTSDQTGSGTAKVKFEITASGMPVDELVRENMFYTTGNIGELAIAEIFEAMAILTGNKYNPVNIIDLKVEVEVEKERRTASIMEAVPNKTTAKPGEKIEVAVKLKPYRQEPILRKVSFTVPKDQSVGNMMVSVRGGGVVSLAQLISKRQEKTDNNEEENLAKLLEALAKPTPKTFEAAIKDLTERDRYHDIVLEIFNMDNKDSAGKPGNQPSEKSTGIIGEDSDKTPDVPTPPEGLDGNPESKTANTKIESLKDLRKRENQRKFNITTDHIVDSETQFMINVVK